MSASHGWALVDQARKQEIIAAIRSGDATRGPVHAELDLTDRCNVACYFCNQMDVRTRESIPLEKVLSVLDELVEGGLKSVRLSGGGDPLMYPAFPAVQEALAERGVTIDNLTTNGALLRPEIAEGLVRHQAREVIFSLNAADPLDYQRMLQVGAKVFGQVVDNVRHLVKVRGDQPLPTVILQFLLDPQNYAKLPEMYRLGRSLGVDRITLNAVLEIPRDRLDPETLLGPEDFPKVRPYLAKVLAADRDAGLMQVVFPWDRWNEGVEELRQRMAAPSKRNPFPTAASYREDIGHCFFGWYSATIRGTGEMYPCCMLMNPDYKPLANVLEGGFGQAWKEGGFQRLRQDMREVFLTGGRIFRREKRLPTLRRQCIEPHQCGLKNMYFRGDEEFYRELGEAVDSLRAEEVRWFGGWKPFLRAAEIFAFRAYHGTLVRGRALGRRLGLSRARQTMKKTPTRPRLHLGCGDKHLDGWINIDHQALPGVDVVADVTKGLQYSDVEAVYAEHFLEHLPILAVLDFFGECHRVLGQDGALRLSTPNLDWVWLTHYHLGAGADEKSQMAINLNRAFHGWEHQFLWNREMLSRALEASGFTDLRWHLYGESDREIFRGLERHDTYDDSPDLPHVLIVEATKAAPQPKLLQELRDHIQRDFLNHMRA